MKLYSVSKKTSYFLFDVETGMTGIDPKMNHLAKTNLVKLYLRDFFFVPI
jgi:hypothetical protein